MYSRSTYPSKENVVETTKPALVNPRSEVSSSQKGTI